MTHEAVAWIIGIIVISFSMIAAVLTVIILWESSNAARRVHSEIIEAEAIKEHFKAEEEQKKELRVIK